MPRAKAGGFTLLEIILAIAVMALIATTIIGASAHLLNSRTTSPDDIFWQAVAAARKMALQSGADTRLSYDEKAKGLAVNNGLSIQSFALPSKEDLAVNFLTTQAGASSVLIGGTLVETQTMPFATFYPDGTCVPFRVQIRQGSSIHSLAIDPWTCARVLHPPDPNGTVAN